MTNGKDLTAYNVALTALDYALKVQEYPAKADEVLNDANQIYAWLLDKGSFEPESTPDPNGYVYVSDGDIEPKDEWIWRIKDGNVELCRAYDPRWIPSHSEAEQLLSRAKNSEYAEKLVPVNQLPEWAKTAEVGE